MFQGYLEHAGVEIANSRRTMEYVANMAPGLQFVSCWHDDGLDCVLGDDGYRTPALDPAPWFSESRPGSAKFLGFYPLSVEGIEDSSRSMKVTELVEDGAVLSLPRRASKEFRVRGLMMATDGEGLDAGMRWLRGALEAKDCTRCVTTPTAGDCAGHDFDYLAYLPNCCDYSEYPARPVDWSASPGDTGGWVGYGEGAVTSQSSGVRVVMPCDGDGAQWYVENLIPGQNYRLRLVVRSSRQLTVSVSGRESRTAKRENVQGTLTRTPWVIDFVAQAETESIKVYQAEPGCYNAQAIINEMRVDRIAERSKIFEPRFVTSLTQEQDSWEWITPTEPAALSTSASLATPLDVEAITFEWENTSGTTINLDAGTGVRRVIRGLRPGEEYVVTLKAQVTGGVDFEPDIEGVSTNVMALGGYWFRMTFTATSPAHYLVIGATSGFTISGTSSVLLEANYLRVDLDVSGMVIPRPDQGRDARRELHGVELLNGPNIIQTYRTNAPTVMTEVEFSMAVARPYVYSELYTIPPAPSATTTLLANTPCVHAVVAPIQDPDCDPLPVAPQPPSITPDCVSAVTDWRRYWMEVPSELAGGWAESVPVITITTGASAVRDVRIRFYPNTGNEPVEDLDPCAYCGEFYVAYIPADTVFNIDAIDRTVLANVAGAGEARAMHLVSDENYGPIQWPTMSCDIPYYVTVDIAPDEVLDVNFDLSVALRE